MQAYFNYVNSQGVCGWTLELATGDDRLDAGTNRSETQRLAGEAFAFVGGISVVDNGGAGVLAGTQHPRRHPVDRLRAHGAAEQLLPNPIDPAAGNGTEAIMRHFAGQGVAAAAVVYPAQADAALEARPTSPTSAAGIAAVDTYEVAITETNYVNVAQQIENRARSSSSPRWRSRDEPPGAGVPASRLSPAGALLRRPGLRQPVPRAGRPGRRGDGLAVTHNIFEDAGSVPSVATFLDYYRNTAPGSDPTSSR